MIADTLTPPAQLSATRAFVALVWFSVRRQWRVRQMGAVALGLLALLAVTVGVISHGPTGWGLPERYSFRFQARVKHIPASLDLVQMTPGPSDQTALVAALFAPLRAVLADEKFLADWEFLNFSRWVVFSMHLGFYLPLVTLAYASAGLGTERESRTLIWLTTRPIPRWALYLAKFLGGLPWCLLASVGGFGVLCLAGGNLGPRAFATFWPTVAGVTVAFAALFHLLGALVRRPAVVGLVYIFFFETLVANLPGSLKEFSLNYYARSLLYADVTEQLDTVTPANLDVYAPADPVEAWLILAAVTVGLTLVGMWRFTKLEPPEAD